MPSSLSRRLKPIRYPRPHEVVQVRVAGQGTGHWICTKHSCGWQGGTVDAMRHVANQQWLEHLEEETSER